VSSICTTLQHSATPCHPATPRNTLQHPALQHPRRAKIYPQSAPPCNTLQHPATPCNTLQHPATPCNTQQHPATHIYQYGEESTQSQSVSPICSCCGRCPNANGAAASTSCLYFSAPEFSGVCVCVRVRVRVCMIERGRERERERQRERDWREGGGAKRGRGGRECVHEREREREREREKAFRR